MTETMSTLHVQVIEDTPMGGTRHLVLHFDRPLLKEGEQRFVYPGDHALDHLSEYSTLLQHIMRALFAQGDIGVKQVVLTPETLTIDHYAALSQDRIFSIIRRAASRAHFHCDARPPA